MQEKLLSHMASVHLEGVHDKTVQAQHYSINTTIKKYHMKEQEQGNDTEMDLLVLNSALQI